jgi:hypothetical protein
MTPISELITQFAEDVRKTTGDLPLTIKLSPKSFTFLTRGFPKENQGVKAHMTSAEVNGVLVTKGGEK